MKNFRILSGLSLAIAALFALPACDGGEPTTAPQPPAPADRCPNGELVEVLDERTGEMVELCQPNDVELQP